MLTLEEHRRILKRHLPERAFLKTDVGDALFVSDAPRFTQDEVVIPGYDIKKSGNTLRITPDFKDVPEKLRKIMPSLLKQDRPCFERMIRANLAIALREHDKECALFLQKLLYQEDKNEA